MSERASGAAGSGALRRILVRMPNWLGDALLARPLLFALRAAHPGAEIRVLGPEPVLALLARDGNWNEAHCANAPGAALAGLTRWAEAALVLPPSFSSAWQALRLAAKRRIGFAGDGRGWLLTDSIARPPRGDLHLSREYLLLGERVGAGELPAEVPSLQLPESARDRARRWLIERGLGERPLVLLGPGAIFGPAKRWPPERFAEVGRALAASGYDVLVCGTPAEREVCENVARRGGAWKVAAGETDLMLQAALCSLARLSVCNDSGLAHLSAAAGSATVAIFGSTSSAWTAPRGDRVRIVQRPPVCSPCFQRTCAIGYECLTRVDAARVGRACEELLA